MKNSVGICTIALKNTAINEVIRIASEAGADGIEVWGQPEHIRYPLDERTTAEIGEKASQADLEVCALGSYYRPCRSPEYHGVAVIPQNQVRIASLLGTSLIRIWAGSQNFDECSGEERKRVCAEIRQFAEVARDAGLTVVLERHSGTLTNSWSSPAAVLDEIRMDNVFLNYQVVYPTGIEDLKAHAVKDYQKYLPISAHAHLQNYTRGGDGTLRRSFLEDGVIDYSLLGDAAVHAGYTGFFMIEFLPDTLGGLTQVEALRRDIQFLRALSPGTV